MMALELPIRWVGIQAHWEAPSHHNWTMQLEAHGFATFARDDTCLNSTLAMCERRAVLMDDLHWDDTEDWS